MNYREAMAFLETTKKYGCQPGLTSIRSLMEELGNVQELVPVVHIGGTNGKGSVGAMLSEVLIRAGYCVGRFETPDVFSYEEEFLINGKPIKKDRLARVFTTVAQACDKLVKKGLPHPTRFEAETAAAFLWFYEEKCEIALIEVGMGGAGDATNLITRPLVSVLTSISMDHMRFLGNTLAGIASEKAGIIKTGCPVVCMNQPSEALAVIRERASRLGADFVLADAGSARDIQWSTAGMTFSVKRDCFEEASASQEMVPISVGLFGSFQVENAVCALYVFRLLQQRFPNITETAILVGLRKVRWAGRFEILASHPTVIIDGAHNEDAVKKLRESLDMGFPEKKIIYIMGVLADKDYDQMISRMFREGDRIFTVTPPSARALSAETLAKQLKMHKLDAVACETLADAVRFARRETADDDVILAFGSLSYLGGVRREFCGSRE